MADRFSLDADAVKARTRSLDHITGHLRDAFGDLNDVLDLNDGCWGTDDIGKKFAEGYDPTTMRTNAKSELTNLDGWSDNVRTVVDDFTDLDHENADYVRKVDHEFAQQLEEDQKKS